MTIHTVNSIWCWPTCTSLKNNNSFLDGDLFLEELGKEMLRGLDYRVTDVIMPNITGLDKAKGKQQST